MDKKDNRSSEREPEGNSFDYEELVNEPAEDQDYEELSIVQVAKQCAEEKQCHGKETGVIHGAIVPVEAVTLKFHCLNTQKAENGRNGDPFSASSRQKTAEQRTQQIKNTSAQ